MARSKRAWRPFTSVFAYSLVAVDELFKALCIFPKARTVLPYIASYRQGVASRSKSDGGWQPDGSLEYPQFIFMQTQYIQLYGGYRYDGYRHSPHYEAMVYTEHHHEEISHNEWWQGNIRLCHGRLNQSIACADWKAGPEVLELPIRDPIIQKVFVLWEWHYQYHQHHPMPWANIENGPEIILVDELPTPTGQ